MNQALLDKIESAQYRKDSVNFGVGDSVRVHTKVVEGDKERIQIFSGVVIGRRGHGLNSTFTVRRISYGEGVERVFPVHSPRVDKIEIERKGGDPPRQAHLPAHPLGQGRHAGERKGSQSRSGQDRLDCKRPLRVEPFESEAAASLSRLVTSRSPQKCRSICSPFQSATRGRFFRAALALAGARIQAA